MLDGTCTYTTISIIHYLLYNKYYTMLYSHMFFFLSLYSPFEKHSPLWNRGMTFIGANPREIVFSNCS